MSETVLMLGASNLFFLQVPLKSSLGERRPGIQIEIHAAPGRSYCVRGGIFPFWLRPLLSIPSPPDLSAVLLMDLGADILYGVPTGEISQRLIGKIEDWRKAGVRVVAVPVFEKPLETMSHARYLFFRSIFFMTSRLSLEKCRAGVGEVNAELRRCAVEDGGFTLIEGLDSHLGPDGLHFVKPLLVIERLREALLPM